MNDVRRKSLVSYLWPNEFIEKEEASKQNDISSFLEIITMDLFQGSFFSSEFDRLIIQ